MWFDETRSLLGSVLRVTFECSDQFIGSGLMSACWERIGVFERKYSRFLKDTLLEKMNSRVGEWQSIDEETFGHFQRVRDLEDTYPLGFSLAVKGALERIGYDSNYTFEEKERVINRDASRDFLLRDGEVFLYHPVEFGGFGKGYALDMVVEVLKNECQNICLDFGGDLYAKGLNEKGERWRVVIESPFMADEAIGIVELDGLFLTTSNTLKRRWGTKGEYHHLIDPITGIPANYWVGVSVLATSGMEADFLATALFCTSLDRINLASEALSKRSFLLIDPQGQLRQSNFPIVLFS